MKKHIAKRLDKENHLYRGKVIALYPHIPSGYHGRYRVIGKWFSYLADAKKAVDDLCEEKGISSFMNDEEVALIVADYKI